jgi:hypothetical protein
LRGQPEDRKIFWQKCEKTLAFFRAEFIVLQINNGSLRRSSHEKMHGGFGVSGDGRSFQHCGSRSFGQF